MDGVGYPSVGSICNLSNAHIAKALDCPVLLVGKAGVGDAVDSFNMNARFFESYGTFLYILNCIDAVGIIIREILQLILRSTCTTCQSYKLAHPL